METLRFRKARQFTQRHTANEENEALVSEPDETMSDE